MGYITMEEAGRKVNCIGYSAVRLNDRRNDLEKSFAEAWQEANNPPSHINSGIPLIRQLRAEKFDLPHPPYHHTTVEEERIAATVIQWLGTECGVDFLRQCGFEEMEGECRDAEGVDYQGGRHYPREPEVCGDV